MAKIMIETSARHIHLSQQDLETLFGKGYSLTLKKELSQPGEFACEERLTVKGPKNEIKNVVILGPVRKQTQVEISLTDARGIGLSIPIRESGDLAGSAGCTMIGPKGTVELKEGVIAAKRHIHLTEQGAKEFGVENKQIVQVAVETNGRSLVFGDGVVRVNSSYANAMHMDTDEDNAAAITPDVMGTIIK